MIDYGHNEWRLCHGVVLGQYREDVFSHCWIEHPTHNQAIIMSTDVTHFVNAEDYRHAMSAHIVDEFSQEELVKLIGRYGNFGPFDRELKAIGTRVVH